MGMLRPMDASRRHPLPSGPAPHPSWLWRFVQRCLAPFFRRVEVDKDALHQLAEAHAKGAVIHVFRWTRILDPIFLLALLRRRGLAAPRWILRHPMSPVDSRDVPLPEVLAADASAVVHLRAPATLLSPQTTVAGDHIRHLIAYQRTAGFPIFLVPESLLYARRPVGLRRSLIDAIFGNREAPGAVREIFGFLWYFRSSRFHIGAPINLNEFVERNRELSDAVIAKKVRWALLQHLAREEQLRTGPRHRSRPRTRQMVLKDPQLRNYMQSEIKRGVRAEAVEKKAVRMLGEIAADIRYGWLRVTDALIDIIWQRIYDGIVVDQEGLKAAHRAARRGPVVVLPSHKSHIDYLVLSQVFFKKGLMPPHIAAGENLNFWPLGPILRKSGAFFIRRSFKGDKLYTFVIQAYIRRLLKEGHAVEFFIEGGRSRTGKLLAPKYGLLSMCLDAVVDGSIPDIHFVPVSIGYEKVIEADSYRAELAGAKKKKEDMGALLSSSRILRSRYGRVYVDFSEPVSFRAFLAARDAQTGGPSDAPMTAEKAVVRDFAQKVIHDINRVTRVTPSSIIALVLLGQTRRGIELHEVLRRGRRLVAMLRDQNARVSGSLAGDDVEGALQEAVEWLASDEKVSLLVAPDGRRIVRMEDGSRQALDYYKNNIVHFLVPPALYALACLRQARTAPANDPTPTYEALLEQFSAEFPLKPRPVMADPITVAQHLAQWGVLSPQGAAHEGPNWKDATWLAGIVGPFLDAQRILLDPALVAPPRGRKRFLEDAQRLGETQVLEGRLAFPECVSSAVLRAALDTCLGFGALKLEEGRVAAGPEHDALQAAAMQSLEVLEHPEPPGARAIAPVPAGAPRAISGSEAPEPRDAPSTTGVNSSDASASTPAAERHRPDTGTAEPGPDAKADAAATAPRQADESEDEAGSPSDARTKQASTST